jgi:hypothetical protein
LGGGGKLGPTGDINQRQHETELSFRLLDSDCSLDLLVAP